MTEQTAAAIWCPNWCTVPMADHEAEVAAGDVTLVHQGPCGSPSGNSPMDLSMSTLRTPEGGIALEDEDRGAVMFLDGDELVHPHEVEKHARDLLGLVEAARRTGPEKWLTCPSWCSSRGGKHHPMDSVEGRHTEDHHGYPLGPRFAFSVEYFADTGDEIRREMTLRLDEDSARCDGESEVVTAAQLAVLADQAERAAAWARGEVEIP